MTKARKFRATITSNRLLRVPDDAPTGPVVVTIESSPSEAPLDEDRAVRRANRARLAGELEGKIWIADDAFAPLTEEELEEWYRPLDPDP